MILKRTPHIFYVYRESLYIWAPYPFVLHCPVGTKMEDFGSIFLLILSSFLVSWLLRVGYSIWWKPMMLGKCLKEQGIKGTPYKLLFGDMKESLRMTNEAWSKPMSVSHQIVPRVNPHLHETVKNYGKLSLTWAGTAPMVNIMEPELIKEILSNKFGHFQKPAVTNPLFKLLAFGLSALEGEKWAKHRRIINPAFHLEKLKGMLPAFATSCEELIRRWEASVGSVGACELDVWVELQNLTGDVISRTAFGSSYEEGKKIFTLQKELSHLVINAARRIYLPGFRFLPTKRNIRIKRLDKEIKSMLRGLIQRREQAMKMGECSHDDLLSLLLESNSNNGNGLQEHERNTSNIGLTIDEVIEECKLFYFAGQETTSVLLTWTMVVLSMHQDWQEKAREEVLQICGRNTPNLESLNHLKIVTMILYEVLRLYPPVTLFFRHTYKRMKLGEITFPAGVVLLLPTITIHHDSELWGEHAEEFKPERFAEGVAKASKHQLAFFPFGWGPRICIGQNFAMMEAKIALAMILQHFSFRLSPTYTHAPYTVITLQPQHGAQIMLRKL